MHFRPNPPPLEFQIMTPGGPNMAILGSNCPFSGVRDPFVRFPRASDPNWVENGRKRGKMHFRPNCSPPLEFQIMTPGAKYGDFGVKLPIFEGEKSIYEVSKAIETKLRHFIMGGPKMAVFRIFFRFFAITQNSGNIPQIFFL